MKLFILAAIAVAAVVHLLPLTGVLGADWLNKLYGRSFDDPNLLVLMRHRAVLFGLIGVFLLAALWQPAWRLPAAAMAVASMAGYIAITWLHQPINAELKRVALVDWGALALLLPAILLLALRPELRQ